MAPKDTDTSLDHSRHAALLCQVMDALQPLLARERLALRELVVEVRRGELEHRIIVAFAEPPPT